MNSKVTLHPTSIVADTAVIGEGTTVGPYSIIGPKVKLGRNCYVGPHVVIEGNTTLGDSNKIFQFASVGSVPQDLKFKGEDSTVVIGTNNTIREYVTIQPGTHGGGMTTQIGHNNLFMANSHVGHDCIVGDKNILANSVALSGHVTLENCVTIGGLSGIHQFVRLGSFCFLGAGSMVAQDVPPYCMAQGDRAQMVGLNQLGLERGGFNEDDIKILRKVYRHVFLQKGILRDKLTSARIEYQNYKGVIEFLNFIQNSERGVCSRRAKGKVDAE